MKFIDSARLAVTISTPNCSSKKLRDFYGATVLVLGAMNGLIKVLFSDAEVFGYSIHIWILCVAAIGIFWAFILIRDL
jgi:hypothetical protein